MDGMYGENKIGRFWPVMTIFGLPHCCVHSYRRRKFREQKEEAKSEEIQRKLENLLKQLFIVHIN